MSTQTQRESETDTEHGVRPEPPADSLVEDRMFAKVAAAMFGDQLEPTERTAAPKLGPYFVLEAVGRGAMGTVYSAYDADLDRRVAVKLLHDDRGRDDSVGRQRLLREARALARLTHPNVVTVHGVGSSDRGIYLAMEFVEGQTLAGFMAREPSLDAILDVFIAAGRGLAAAHAVGLVHRDFKPANVLIGADGVARVADFGLARPAALASTQDAQDGQAGHDEQAPERSPETGDLTRTGALVGTPAYMAPEQFEGSTVGPAADQFAFCVSLYEAVHGRLPYARGSIAALATAKANEDIRPGGGRAPGWLARVIERGLRAEPSRRFADMDALVHALERGRGSQARRRRVAGVGVVGFGLVVGLWAAKPEPPAPAPAPCAAAGAAIAELWTPARRAELGLPEGPSSSLDDYAAAWSAQATKVCEDREAGRISTRIADARTGCLDHALDDFGYTLGLLGRDDPSIRKAAKGLIAGLPGVDACEIRAEVVPLRVQADGEAERAQRRDVLARGSQAHQLGRAGKPDEAEPIIAALWAEHPTIADPWARAEVARLAALKILDGEAKEQALRASIDDGIRSGHYQLQAFSYLDLADLLAKQGREVEVAAALDSAAAAVDAMDLYGDNSPKVHRWAELIRGRIANLRGMYFDRAGRPDEALRSWQVALDHWGGVTDPPRDRLIMGENNVGEGLQGLGRSREAAPHFAEALSLSLASFGPKHPFSLQIRSNLAAAYLSLGRLGEARRELDQALTELGDKRPAVAADLLFLRALVEIEAEAIEPATADLDAAAAIWAEAKGKGAAKRELAAIGQARLERAQGLAKLSLTWTEPAVAGLAEAYGEDHPLTTLARLEHARALLARGDRAAARDQAERAQAALTASQAFRGEAAAEVHRLLALTLPADASASEAAAELEAGLTALEAEAGKAHPRAAELGNDLAELWLAAGDLEQARAALDRARAGQGEGEPLAPGEARRSDAIAERLTAAAAE